MAIDDDKAILDVISIILSDEGYNVTTLSQLDNLLEKVRGIKPDLILLDILMQGEDGREIIKLLRNNPETEYIPIVMLSANTETQKIAKVSGATAFLEKPFEIEDLVTVVEKNVVKE